MLPILNRRWMQTCPYDLDSAFDGPTNALCFTVAIETISSKATHVGYVLLLVPIGVCSCLGITPQLQTKLFQEK